MNLIKASHVKFVAESLSPVSTVSVQKDIPSTSNLKKKSRIKFVKNDLKADVVTSTDQELQVAPESESTAAAVEEMPEPPVLAMRPPTTEELRAIALEDAEVQAFVASEKQRMLEEAKAAVEAEIEGLKAQQQSEIEAAKQEAKLEVASKFKALLDESQNILKQAAEEKKKIMDSLDEELLKLSVDIAKKVVLRELKTDNDLIYQMISEASAKVTERESVVLKVSREDIGKLRAEKERIQEMFFDVKDFSMVEDPHVDEGGCILESKMGIVDARLSMKLQMIQLSFNSIYAEDKAAELKRAAKKTETVEQKVEDQAEPAKPVESVASNTPPPPPAPVLEEKSKGVDFFEEVGKFDEVKDDFDFDDFDAFEDL